MTLEPAGVTGRVSDHIDSDHIVDGRPRDRIHVQVYHVPEGGSAYDVVLRAAEDEKGDREVIGSWTPTGVEGACVRAVDIGETHGCVIWDDIIRLTRAAWGGGDELEPASSSKVDWEGDAFPASEETMFGDLDEDG